jgi:carbon-monoxide dehydrogenase catalytic subunit
VASGIYTVLGTVPPVLGGPEVTKLLTQGAEQVVGAKFAVEADPFKAADLIEQHINHKRVELGLPVAELVAA